MKGFSKDKKRTLLARERKRITVRDVSEATLKTLINKNAKDERLENQQYTFLGIFHTLLSQY